MLIPRLKQLIPTAAEWSFMRASDLRRWAKVVWGNISSLRGIEATFWILVVVVLVPGAVLTLIYWPELEVNQRLALVKDVSEARRFELINEARRTLTQIIFGIFGLLALFLTWRRVRATDRTTYVTE